MPNETPYHPYPAQRPSPMDQWIQAYLAPTAPEIFHAITSAQQIHTADPFDVETIHQEARESFACLVDRVRNSRTSGQAGTARGSILVLLGESGSGKTHLLRAFRHYAHRHGIGYCGYMQMTSIADNYARYILQYVIDSLQYPYLPQEQARGLTGLERLATRLLEQVPSLTAEQRHTFRDTPPDLHDLVIEYVDRLTALDRFYRCDSDLLRIVLYLSQEDHRIRMRAIRWLRCEPITQATDLQLIGQITPRAQPEDPLRMLVELARLIAAVDQVPLILLLDQLEDLATQPFPEEQFRRLIDAVTALVDQSPHTVAVLACLEDYYTRYQPHLTRSKVDRLVHDTEPLRLTNRCSQEDIKQLLHKRLAYLYAHFNLPDPPNPLHPFQEQQLNSLVGLRVRDILQAFHTHQHQCRRRRQWLEFPLQGGTTPVVLPPEPALSPLEQLWCQHLAQFDADLPEQEEQIAGLLARIIPACSVEMPDGVHFTASQPAMANDRYVEVQIHGTTQAMGRFLVAVCNRKAQGGGLGKQLEELMQQASGTPVAVVRLEPFPKTPKTKALHLLSELIRLGGRRVQLQESDLRHMAAFEAFWRNHGQATQQFCAWQRQARPLTKLAAMQQLLDLKNTDFQLADAVNTSPPPPTPPPSTPLPAAIPSRLIRLGVRTNTAQTPVDVNMDLFLRHAAFLGGTGTGKTTAALNILEQLLYRGIPALLIDRKGDLCRYADSQAWEEPLADPDHRSYREELRQRLDIVLYTPGNNSGRQLALSLFPADSEPLEESELSYLVSQIANALGQMLGLGVSSNHQAQSAILTKAVEVLARRGSPLDVTIPALRELIQNRDDELVCSVGDTYRQQHYTALAERLQTLWVQHQGLFQGQERLVIPALLGVPTAQAGGRTRLVIINTRFLASDAAREFWLAQLFIALGRWCSLHPSQSLQAVVLLDEADVYLPATGREPATKPPLENLLRRARSAGLALFLASQSPGDFDYRCRENIGSWFLGRIQQDTALRKLRPMFAGAQRLDAHAQLGGLPKGHFYFLGPDGSLDTIRSNQSIIRPLQLPEQHILKLARALYDDRQPPVYLG